MSYKKLGVSPKELKKHTGDTSNPHKVTKKQVGLSNVDNVKQAPKKDFDSHVNDVTKHITAEERESWNAKETPAGAQAKATKVLGDAKKYTDQQISEIPEVDISYLETKEDAKAKLDDAKFYTDVALDLEIIEVDDKISELDSEDINVIDAMPSDAPLTDYPKGVSTFYINVTDAGYPHRYGTVTTYTGGSSITGYQTFVLNNFNASRRKIFIRYYHNNTGWSEWYEIADNREIEELKKEISDLRNAIIQLKDKG